MIKQPATNQPLKRKKPDFSTQTGLTGHSTGKKSGSIPLNFKNLLDKYLVQLKKNKSSESTIRNYRSDLQQYLKFSQEKNLTPTHLNSISQFKKEQAAKGLKTSSVRRKITSINNFLEWIKTNNQNLRAQRSKIFAKTAPATPVTKLATPSITPATTNNSLKTQLAQIRKPRQATKPAPTPGQTKAPNLIPVKIEEYIGKYLVTLKNNTVSDTTIRNYRSDIRQFATYMRKASIAELLTLENLKVFALYQKKQGLKLSTIQRKLVSTTQFSLWAQRRKLVTGVKPDWAPLIIDDIFGHDGVKVTIKTPQEKEVAIKNAKKKRKRDSLLAALILLLLLFGSSIGIYLVQTVQDLRQQASTGPEGAQVTQEDTSNTNSSFALTQTGAGHTIPFRGKLYSQDGSAILGETPATFTLFDSPGENAKIVWESGRCLVESNPQGIFDISLGSGDGDDLGTNDCGSIISDEVYYGNSNLWLLPTLGGEELALYPIRTVKYSEDSALLAGNPLGDPAATAESVLFMNDNGDILFDESPTFYSDEDLTLQGDNLYFITENEEGGKGGAIFDSYIYAPGAILTAEADDATPLTIQNSLTATAPLFTWEDELGNTLGVIDADGNIGIGTNSPTGQLGLGISGAYVSSFNDELVFYDADTATQYTLAELATDNVGGTTYWTQTGTQITYNSGNVGIGDITTEQALTVDGNIQLGVADGERFIYFDDGTSDNPGFRYNATDNKLQFRNSGTSWSDFGSGDVASVNNSDSTLTISPTTGNVVASLNLANANTWTATQTFADVAVGGALNVTGTSTLSTTTLGATTLDSAAVGTTNSVIVREATGLLSQRTADDRIWGSTLVDGVGVADSVAYWTNADTLAAEQYLNVTRGGLGGDVTALGAGELLYSTSTTAYDSLAAGSASQLLISGGAATPSWSNVASLLTAGDDIDITGTTTATIALEDDIDLTSLRASSIAGLSIYDDGGVLGLFVEDTTGDIGINTSAPEQDLTVASNIQLGITDADRYIYFDNGTTDNAGFRYNSTSDKLEYSDDGTTWAEFGSGTVSSVSNVDGTLTISPTTGDVVASLNLANANTWTATQTFTDVAVGGTLGVTGTTTLGTTVLGTAGVGTTDSVVTREADGTLSARTIDTRAWGSSLIDGAGTADYVTYWSDADTLTAEQYLATARGGLGSNVTALGAGELLYSTSTTAYDSLAAGTANQLLISGGAATPSWSDVTSLLTAGDDIDITGTTTATIALEDDIDLTSLRASSVSGLSIYDDGSVLGLFVADLGNVGVGTNLPSSTFNVDVGAQNQNIRFEADATYSTGVDLFSGTDYSQIVQQSDGSFDIQNRNLNEDLNLKVNDGGSLVDALTVQGSSSNVGIGTVSPEQVLTVDGNIQLGITDGERYIYFDNGTTDNAGFRYEAVSNVMQFSNDGTTWNGFSSASGVVNSVSDDGNGTLTISPTTGDVLAAINLTNINTWTGLQTFDALAIADTDIALTGASTNFTATGDVSFNTDDLFIEKLSGNVGIGDATPTALLSVGSGDLFKIDSAGRIVAIDGVAHSIDDETGDLTITSNSTSVDIADDLAVSGDLSLVSLGDQITFADDGYINSTADNTIEFQSGGTTNFKIADRTPLSVQYTDIFTYASLVVNEDGAAYDFRAEGDTDTHLLYADATNDKVGIGTSAPLAKLDLGQAGTATSTLTQANSEDLALTGSFWTGAAEALHSFKLQNIASTTVDEAGRLAFSWDSSELLTLNSSGNLGIGATNPSAELDLVGNFEQTSSVTTGTAASITADSLTTGTLLSLSHNGDPGSGGAGPDISYRLLDISDTRSGEYVDAGTEERINISEARTYTGGASSTETTNYFNLERSSIVNAGVNTFTVDGALMRIAASTTETSGNIVDSSNILALEQNCGAGTCSGEVMKITGKGTGNLLSIFDNTTEVFTVADGGNVGIGVASPNAYLDLAAATTGKAQLHLTTSATVNPSSPNSGDLWWNGAELYFYDGSTSNDLLAGGSGTVDGSGTANYLPKWSDSNTLTDSVLYDDGTNIGIGTATPSQELDLIGNLEQTSSTTTGTAASITADSLTTGTLLSLSHNGDPGSGGPGPDISYRLLDISDIRSGDWVDAGTEERINISEARTYTSGTTTTETTNYLNLERSTIADGGAGTLTVAGALMRIASSTTETSSSIVDSANILALEQNCGAGTCSGEVMKITGKGTGNLLSIFDNTTEVFTVEDGGNVGIGVTAPTAFLDLAAATTAKAQLNLTASAAVDPSTPGNGDLWWNGTNLYFYDGSTSNDLLAGGGGTIDGSGTANYITKWTDSDTITTSVLYDNGTNVGIGTTLPEAQLTTTNNIQLGVADATRYIYFDNGTATNSGIRYNATTDTMQYSHDGGNWYDFINSTTTADSTFFTNTDAAVASGSYLDVAHNQATYNVVTTAFINNGTNWIEIDDLGRVAHNIYDPNLIGWYKAEEASGDLDNAEGTSSRDLIDKGTPTYAATGKINDSITLDGTSDFFCTGSDVTCADDDNFDFDTTSFSLGGWFKHDTITTNPDYLVSKYSDVAAIDTGDGEDGAITVSSSTNINTTNLITTPATRTCSDGGDAVNYSISSLTSTVATLSTTPSTGCIIAGDEVLVINLQGTTSSAVNTGNWETFEVDSVSSNTITFAEAKTKYYGDGTTDDLNIGTGTGNQRVMIQRVPNYTSVTVNSSINFYPTAWNGAKGGVMFFRATGTVSATGSIHADEKGYRGGSTAKEGGEAFCADNQGSGGSAGGNGSNSTCGGGGGGGAIANSTQGNGGTGSSTGGAGGGGGTSSGINYTQPYGGNGAGGGYGLTGDLGESYCSTGDGTAGGTNTSGDGGDACNQATDGRSGGGGGGGSYGDTALVDMYFGSGGGGGGDGGNASPGVAGNGGGIVYIAANSVTVSGTIKSNGGAGVDGNCTDAGDGKVAFAGGGGGGAGGSVYVAGDTLTLGISKVTGSGGTAGGYDGTGCYNITGDPQGGDGGVGRIHLDYVSSLTGTASPTADTDQVTASSGGYKLYMNPAGDYVFGIDDDQSSFPADSASTATNPYDDNAWHHVVAVKDDVDFIKIFVDGQEVAADYSLTASGSLSNTDPFYLGVDSDESSNPWDGTFDEFFTYSRALSAGEVEELYQSNSKFRIEIPDNNTVRLYNDSSATQNLKLNVVTNSADSSSVLGAVSLAPSTADTDPGSTTNSIWVDRTLGSGNLFKFQSSGADELTLTYDGQLKFGTNGSYITESGSDLTFYDPTHGSTVTLSTLAAGGSSSWTVSGSDIYYSTGNVGIGTSSPEQELNTASNIQLGTTDATRYVYFDNGTANNAGIRYESTSSKMQFSHDGTTWADMGTGSGGDNTFFTNTNAAVANGSYLDVSHSQNTYDLVTTAFVNNGTNWVEIDDLGRVSHNIYDPNLVSWYKSEEASGDLDNAEGTAARDLIDKGSPTYAATGKINNAITLDGTSDFFCTGATTVCADNDDFDFGTGSFSLGGWFKHDTIVTNPDYLVTKYSNTAAVDTGDGADGAVTISADTSINTTNSISGRTCADGGDAVNYSVTALTTNTATLESSPSTGCLVVGDEVLLINLRGAYTAFSNAGNYETLTISDVTGGVVTFDSNKTNYYGDGVSDDTNIGVGAGNQAVMLQRVPNYTTLTVDSTYNFYPDDWVEPTGAVNNGAGEGGVIFFRATGALAINGSIHSNNKGYKGGNTAGDGGDAGGEGGEAFCGTGGIGGGGAGTNGAAGGGGTTANTGGDGYCGGGGGDAGVGSASQGGAGGGGEGYRGAGAGGGYGTAGTGGGGTPAGSNGGTNTSGNGGNSSGSHGGGGGGGTYGDTDLDQIFFGAGGGRGGVGSSSTPGNGGDGGGIVYVAADSVTVNGTISTTAANGGSGSGTYRGPGGGGAGGAIKIIGNSVTLGTDKVTSIGGGGGTSTYVGGAGGDGRIAIEYSTLLSVVSTDPVYSSTQVANESGGYKLYMNPAGDYVFAIDDDQSSFPEDSASTATNPYDDNVWHHVVAVKDNTNSIKIFVDGQEVAADYSIAANTSTSNDNPFYLGVDYDGSSNPWDGSFDEFFTYSRALSPGEIEELYQANSKFRIEMPDADTVRLYNDSGVVQNLKLNVVTSGGATASLGGVSLSPVSANVDTDANEYSIFINRTGTDGGLMKLQADGSNMFVVERNGDVIADGTLAIGGLSSTEQTLDVNGNILLGQSDATRYVYFDNGTADNSGIRYESTSNKMQFSHDGTTWADIGSGSGYWTQTGSDIYYNTGNVGIGTATPTAKLDIAGASSTISNSSGDITLDAFSGNISLSGDSLTSVLNATLSGELTVAGNVGIGTASPISPLTILGTGGIIIRETDDGNTAVQLRADASNSYLDLNSGGTTKIHLDSSVADSYFNNGNVGIGTDTPSYSLDVLGNARIQQTAASTAATLILEGTGDSSASYLKLTDTDTSIHWYLENRASTSNSFRLENYDGTNWTSPFVVEDSAPTDTLYLDSTGFVGINDSSPEVQFDVTGAVSLFKNAVDSTNIKIRNNSATDANRGFLYFQKSGSDTMGAHAATVDNESLGDILFQASNGTSFTSSAVINVLQDGAAGATYIPSEMRFKTSDGTAGTTARITIKPAGNVGIGDNTPLYKLDVNGTLRGFGITDSSDVRFKQDIVDLGPVLDRLLQTRGINYRWIDQDTYGSDLQTGFIAQELETFFPDLVTTDSEGYKSIAYGKMTAVLVEAIKEQQDLLEPILINNEGFLTINGNSINGYSLAYDDGSGPSPINAIAGFAKASIAELTAGAITTTNLIADNVTVAGQSLQNYIQEIVDASIADLPATINPVGDVDLDSLVISDVATGDAVLDIDNAGNLNTTGNISTLGQLNADSISATDINTTNLEASGSSKLGDLLVTGEATVSGDLAVSGILTADNIQVSNIQTGSIQVANTPATSSRIEYLEGKVAEYEEVKAITTQITGDATVSGTLYAANIADFDTMVANAFSQPSLLATILGDVNQIDPFTGFDNTTNNAFDLDIALADLNLSAEDVVIAPSAVFINDYLRVNGSGFIAGSFGVGENLIVGDGLKIGNGAISYTPTDPLANNVFYIQPDGNGTLSLMANLMTLTADGQVTISGDLRVAGALDVAGEARVETSLLTNLIQPLDPNSPIQIQLAEEASQSGQLNNSRFEIVDAAGVPVATISASGKADFAGGLGIDSGIAEATTSGELFTDKTAGKATLPAGQSEITIRSELITDDTLIYVTPLGSTNNQVLYLKEQIAEDPVTLTKEGKFTIGLDFALTQNVEFNWWIVD